MAEPGPGLNAGAGPVDVGGTPEEWSMAKVKGSALAGAVRFLRSRREEAEARIPVDLRHYLDERIQLAAWYPEEDLVDLIRVLLDLLPAERDAALEEMGRQTARQHMEGAYGHLIEGGDPANLRIRAAALWSSMHDSGRMEVTDQAPGRVRLELSGYGHPSEELCKISRGYILEVLRLNGIPARAEKRSCAVAGDPACAWDFTWQGA
jgi:hypothetical protein